MDTGEQVLRTSLTMAEMGMKTSTEIIKALLIEAIKKADNPKLRQGCVKLQKLVDSGEEIKLADLNQKDFERFKEYGKKLGITYAVATYEGGKNTILFRASDYERVEKAVSAVLEDKLKEKDEDAKKLKLEVHQKEIQPKRYTQKAIPIKGKNRDKGSR